MGGMATAGAALVGTFAMFATEKLMKLALNRQDTQKYDKTKRKLSGSKKVSEAKMRAREDGEKLASLEFRDVAIESFDGTMLVGHWYPCENAKRVIIAMHGWRSVWYNNFGSVSEFWHKNGCSVLFAEQRGQGASGGDYMSFGILERYDCLEWARWAEKEAACGLPIYLAGVSMGASTVMMASCLDLPEGVKGIVADCGFTAPHDIWERVVEDKFHIPYELCRRRADKICRNKIKESAKAYSCKDALAAAKVVTYEKYTEMRLDCSYSDYQKYAVILPTFGAIIDDTDFSDRVILRFSVKDAVVADLFAKIQEMSGGKDEAKVLGTRFDYR